MLASLLGDLAKIEHKQKLRRIRSGIAAAQDAGKWTGRPPTGFTVDEDSRLRVDVEAFLRLRAGIERVAAGEDRANVADDIGIATSTLKNAYTDRADLYLYGDADDERLEAAVDEITPLPNQKRSPSRPKSAFGRSFATSYNQVTIESSGSLSSQLEYV